MVPFSVEVIRQKVPLPPKVLVFLGVSKYFLSGFAILLGLFLNPLGLCAEFNSASNGAIFTRGHWAKSVTCVQNTSFPWGFPRYLLSRFAVLLGLCLKPHGLGAELNSESNGTCFEGAHNGKVALIVQILIFCRVLAIRIRYTTWVTSNTIWDMCSI
jgi:hypothetical protein